MNPEYFKNEFLIVSKKEKIKKLEKQRINKILSSKSVKTFRKNKIRGLI